MICICNLNNQTSYQWNSFVPIWCMSSFYWWLRFLLLRRQARLRRITSLKELDLPTSVTDIPGSAFSGCRFVNLIIRGNLCLHPSSQIFNGMDTSTTVYTLASQVNTFIKIYNGAVLPLEDYTLDILPTTSSSGVLYPSYNLQGRRLSGKPTKGVYIRNGEKRVVRW